MPALEERCQAAALVEGEAKAAQVARVAMELVWGLKRVFKREVWSKSGIKGEGGAGEPEAFPVIVVKGRDATRGPYQLPDTLKVCGKVLVKGRKLKDGQGWAALRHTTLDELVGMGTPDKDGPQQRSKWIPKKVQQWLRLLDLVAAGPDPTGDDRCRLCGKEARAVQLGVRLCKN